VRKTSYNILPNNINSMPEKILSKILTLGRGQEWLNMGINGVKREMGGLRGNGWLSW
jgi:hypothetical protein